MGVSASLLVSDVGGGSVVEDEAAGPGEGRTAAIRARLVDRVLGAFGVPLPVLAPPVDPELEDLREAVEKADARILELEEERDALAVTIEQISDAHEDALERAGAAEAQVNELQAAGPMLSSTVAELRRDLFAAQDLVRILMEPSSDGPCQKIRLRSESEARAFAERLLEDTGDVTEPYRCPVCPRQPVNAAHPFWHIRNVDPAMRGQAGRIARGLRRHDAVVNGASLTHRIEIPIDHLD